LKLHTKIYFKHFGYDVSDFIPCEVCGRKAVDIHHIRCRGMGGSKSHDDITNLMALCRECHINFGDKKQHIEFLIEKHFEKINTKTK
jgi:5-methylcytosine-specific restriction endonuclease McrA